MAPQKARTYASSAAAAAAAATASGGKKKKKGMVDPRMENLRVALYPRTRAERGEAPTGVHRPDVVTALERTLPSSSSSSTSTSTESHETITRAFKLFARRKRILHEEELHRKFECMKAAMTELERAHPLWYRSAKVKPDPRGVSKEDEAEFRLYRGTARTAVEARSIEGFFPRELRVPVDTPPRDGWQYDWAPPRKYMAKE